MLLQHDDARPHTGAEMEKIRLQVVPCPPYTAQWALPDLWLFAALKNCLKGAHFACENQAEAHLGKWF